MGYQYKDSLYSRQCYEETNVDSRKVYAEEVTIQCNIMTPYAYLEICLVDDAGKNFLHESQDDAEIPKCCHHDPDDSINESTVCYNLKLAANQNALTPPSTIVAVPTFVGARGCDEFNLKKLKTK